MTAAEVGEWEAYYSISPFGDERGDLQTGLICSMISAIFGGRSSPLDFCLGLVGRAKKERDERLAPALDEAIAAYVKSKKK